MPVTERHSLSRNGFHPRQTLSNSRKMTPLIGNPEAMESILDALGFMPAMIYEKRRETWRLGATEVVIDELPFGLFMEIEGTERNIET